MKVIKISSKGNMLSIGEDERSAKWYFLSEKVEGYVKSNIKVGDLVTIKSEDKNGDSTIVFISKEGNKLGAGSPFKPRISQDFPKQEVKTYGKSPEEQNSIKRQAIGHMVSRSLIALQGQVDINNILSIIDTLYDKYVEKVG